MSRSTRNVSIQDDSTKRQSLRGLSNADHDVNPSADVTPIVAKRLRYSPRFLGECCTEIDGLEHKNYCDGCQRWNNTLIKRKPRKECKSNELRCYEAWKLKPKDVPAVMKKHWDAIQHHLQNNLHIDAKALADTDELLASESNSETTTNAAVENDNGVTPSPPKRKVNWTKKKIRSNGQEFTIEFPDTHVLEHESHVKRWRNDSDILNKMRDKLQSNQYQSNNIFTQTLWSVAMTSVPALALSAAQFVVPLIVIAHLFETGMFTGMSMSQVAKSFPSDGTLRQYNFNQAARDTMSLGREIRDKKVYVAADKGNKKGIGHFVKHLCWWRRDEPGVKVQLLDVDASGGTSKACAQAMRASINKLREVDDDGTNLLYGQTTDSGGGGVLEDFYGKLRPLGLCFPQGYLIANCCIHSLQIQLKNAVVAAFGEGALDKINATQLIHTAYRLQESIDNDQWRHMLFKSSEFVCNYDPAVDNGGPEEAGISAAEKNKRCFLQSFAKIYAFSQYFKKPAPVDPTTAGVWFRTIYSKLAAPILTRWWTVGVASSYVFDCYLILFHACQTVVNMYPSTHTPYAIASDLFSMMSNQETFLDIALVRGFHKAYINKHLDWMQSCVDLTSTQGFQSHNIAVRCCLMEKDVTNSYCDPPMNEYRDCVARWHPENAIAEREKHLDKLNIFFSRAIESLHKHFKRWLSPSLMPCGLMSEAPFAKVISHVMLGRGCPTSFVDHPNLFQQLDTFYFKSEAHNDCKPVNVQSFHCWLRKKLAEEDINDYTQESIKAATFVAADGDLRSFDYNDSVHGELRWHMHSTCLPLASQTQFVERDVKEAKCVSATDRSEEHRTCMAIVRSHTPFGRVKLDDTTSYNSSKIQALIESAKDRSSQHNLWQLNQEDHQHDARYNQMRYSLAGGHSKHERAEQKRAVVDDTGSTFKKPNVHQQLKPQTKTYEVAGLIPHGMLVKARNMQDLEEELLFRGVKVEDLPEKVNDRKSKLKVLEAQRLVDQENMTTKDAAKHRAFKPLSAARFKLTDE